MDPSGVGDALHQLNATGEVESKIVGADVCIWWPSESIVEQRDAMVESSVEIT
jgi:hypothetical protein